MLQTFRKALTFILISSVLNLNIKEWILKIPEMKLEYPFGRGMNFEIDTPDLLILIDSLEKHNYPLNESLKECWRNVGVKGKVYGSKEFRVNDPDGYLLRFSQDLGEKSTESV